MDREEWMDAVFEMLADDMRDLFARCFDSETKAEMVAETFVERLRERREKEGIDGVQELRTVFEEELYSLISWKKSDRSEEELNEIVAQFLEERGASPGW